MLCSDLNSCPASFLVRDSSGQCDCADGYDVCANDYSGMVHEHPDGVHPAGKDYNNICEFSLDVCNGNVSIDAKVDYIYPREYLTQRSSK